MADHSSVSARLVGLFWKLLLSAAERVMRDSLLAARKYRSDWHAEPFSSPSFLICRKWITEVLLADLGVVSPSCGHVSLIRCGGDSELSSTIVSPARGGACDLNLMSGEGVESRGHISRSMMAASSAEVAICPAFLFFVEELAGGP